MQGLLHQVNTLTNELQNTQQPMDAELAPLPFRRAGGGGSPFLYSLRTLQQPPPGTPGVAEGELGLMCVAVPGGAGGDAPKWLPWSSGQPAPSRHSR